MQAQVDDGSRPDAEAAQAAPVPAAVLQAAGGADVARTGYRGFGSFHSDNVEDMMCDPHWQPPHNPCAQDTAALAGTQFGTAFRRHFLVDFDSWVFINHGAFGAPLLCAFREAEAWRRRCEAQPLRLLDRELFGQLVRVTRELAAWLGCRPQDLALLPNATTGLNTVVQSLRGRVGPGDVLFSLDVGYGSVKRMLQVVAEQTGARHVQHSLQLPLSCDDEVIAQVAAALPAGTRLAVFDAVTSNSAIRLPVERLVQLCHSRGAEVLIDGAHALGMLPVDLAALDADYWVANCHKWLAAPRGSAVLHVQPRHQPHVRPLIISHGYGSGFVSEFVWDGCRDYSPLLAVSAALAAWRQLGPEAVRQYQRTLLTQAAGLLAAAWGTGTLVPLHMCGAMALVRLPDDCVAAARAAGTGAGAGAQASPAGSADAKWVQDVLHHQHRVECPVKCVDGRLWVRISAHIYNALDDFRRLAAAVAAIGARRWVEAAT